MLLSIPAGATSKIIQLPVYDSSSVSGALLTGLTNASAGLTAYYNREGAAGASVAIALISATKGTFASGGFIAVDGTNMPGWYELHIPDAALAAGAKSVAIHIKGATNMVPVPIVIELTATSNQDAVRGGMTALPNANAGAANGLPLSVDASGRVDMLKINGTSQTARDIGASVIVATNNDKTGYALTAGEHTYIAADTQSGMTAQGYTGTRGAKLDNLDTNVGSRSTYAGADTAGITELLRRLGSVLTITGGKVDVNDKTGFSLSAAGILAVWNQLTTDGGIVASSFGKKLKDWVLGSDSKAVVSADAQDLSATFKVDAKVVEDKTGYALTSAYDNARTAAQAGDAMDLITDPLVKLNTMYNQSSYNMLVLNDLKDRITAVRAGYLDNLPFLDVSVNSRVATSDTRLDTITAVMDKVSNLSISSRVIATLPSQIVRPASGEAYLQIDTILYNTNGNLMDPPDLTDPGAGPVIRNGFGVVCTRQDGSVVQLYKDGVGTPLDTTTLCHHASGPTPQIMTRSSLGNYGFYLHLSDSTDLGSLTFKFAWFDIAPWQVGYDITSHRKELRQTVIVDFTGINTVINLLQDPGIGLQRLDTELDQLSTAIGAIPTNPVLTTDSRMDRLDANISSRLETVGYTAPDNSKIADILMMLEDDSYGLSEIKSALAAVINNTGASLAELVDAGHGLGGLLAAVNSRLASDTYVAPDNTSTEAVLSLLEGDAVGLVKLQNLITEIPTNPLRADDSRLDHLNADISSVWDATEPNSGETFGRLVGHLYIPAAPDRPIIPVPMPATSELPLQALYFPDSAAGRIVRATPLPKQTIDKTLIDREVRETVTVSGIPGAFLLLVKGVSYSISVEGWGVANVTVSTEDVMQFADYMQPHT